MMSGMIYLRTIAYYRYQRSYHGKILMPSNQHLGCSSSPFCNQEVLCSLPNLASSEPASTPPCYRAWHFILLPAQSQVGSLNWVCRAPYPPQRSSDMSPSQSVRVNSLPLKPRLASVISSYHPRCSQYLLKAVQISFWRCLDYEMMQTLNHLDNGYWLTVSLPAYPSIRAGS